MDGPSGIPFGRYVLRERMARGGMGEVFRAVAMGAGGFEKPVVVKRLLPGLARDPALAGMFVEEARIMSRLAHPNIVQVIDFGQGEQEDYFLVMELVRGVDLGQFRRAFQRRDELVPEPMALYVAQQALRGLAHAHERAYEDDRVLVHRDVSPGNVLLSEVGEVKVADFGVAHVVQPERPAPAAEQTVGKLDYMPPEQYSGESVDGRADVYSLGVVLFELLTHQLPPHQPWARQHAESDGDAHLPSVTTLRPSASPELDAVLRLALAAEPAERFASARAMSKAIAELADGGAVIATSDDLAEAVEQVCAEEPKQDKPVVRLGGGARRDDTPVRELTRTGPADAFTMRVSSPATPGSAAAAVGELLPGPDEPLQSEESSLPEEPALPLSSAGPRLGLAALLILVAMVATWWWLAAAPPDGRDDSSVGPVASGMTASAEEPPEPSAATESVGASTGTTSAPLGSENSERPTVAPSPPAPGTVPTVGPPSTSASSPRPASTASATLPADCQGQVHLYAHHGWSVSGGPSPVQAPGRYAWPCGSYALHAVSRIDGSDKRNRSITVRHGQTAVVDLRQ